MKLKIKKIKKVWGIEKWLINTKRYCGKILILKKGFQCSIHYHKDKDEMFYINKGRVMMQLGRKKFILKKGECVRVKPLVKHKFTSITPFSEVIEFSSHHKDNDSYRITKSCRITEPLKDF